MVFVALFVSQKFAKEKKAFSKTIQSKNGASASSEEDEEDGDFVIEEEIQEAGNKLKVSTVCQMYIIS